MMALRVVVAAVAFAGALAATFPVDAVVRWAVGRVLPAGVPAVAFERARVRPWGIELDVVSMAGTDGAAIAIADRMTMRPSVPGLLVHGTALPCRIRAATCGGTVDASIERDGRVAAGWHDIELARCAPGGRVAGILGGVVDGRARVRVDDPDGARGPGRTRVAVNGLAVHGPELDLTGSGTVEVGGVARDISLDLALRIVPGATAAPALRAFFADVPAADASGARRIAIRGSLAEPRVDPLP
jgi:type II secretion system protein N